MYDPCAQCPCIVHQGTCRKFCAKYKAAVVDDARKGLIEIGRSAHDRFVRTQKGRCQGCSPDNGTRQTKLSTYYPLRR